jgi:hypothetical protein
MVDLSIAEYRNEVYHILVDVKETEDSEKRSIFPRPSQGRRCAYIFTFAIVSSRQQRESGLLSNGFKVF